jgi:hypothetical protein
LNAAEAGANKASARQSLVQRVGQPEQREQHRRQLSRVHRRSSRSMGASQRANQGRSQVPGRVERFRRRVTSENLSVSGSAPRRLLAKVNMDNMTGVNRPEFISRSRLRLLEDLRMKRAANEKECRALTRRRRSTSASSSSNSNEAARLPQPITARDTGSRKVERRDNQKKRHRQVSNNFGAITPAAPERENFGAVFLSPSDAGGVAAFDSFAPAQLTFRLPV